MNITLDEARRLDALNMAMEHSNVAKLNVEEILEAAKKFETYLKGEFNAQNKT